MWVKHPTMTGDGDISLATPKGAVVCPVVDGVFEWPDDLPRPNFFQEAIPSERLVRMQREEAKRRVIEQAKALGLKVETDESEAPAPVPTTSKRKSTKTP
jgi:hypothetical protein